MTYMWQRRTGRSTASAMPTPLRGVAQFERRKCRIALVIAVLALAGWPAVASQAACLFEGGEAPHYYELEFIGYGDIEPVIVFSSTALGSGKRITLPPENYSLKNFSQKSATAHLEFRNPGNDSLPPSFSLTGRGDQSQLKIGSTTVDGSLKCDH